MKVLLGSLFFAVAGMACAAQPGAKPGAQIYTCTDANGKRLTSDRPIPECNAKEQRVLNRDGSVKGVVGPNMTADERAAFEARQAEEARERASRGEALRRDRNLLQRFPNEPAHNKARELALDDARKGLKRSEQRLELLTKERKPLQDEAEFYVGRQMPAKLKQQIDANEASASAQRTLIVNQQAEIVRINELYDAELERLRKLWGGAQPGTLGNLQPASVNKPAASATASK
jgi:hypothetical protein